MKTTFILLMLLVGSIPELNGQNDGRSHQNFPLVISLEFHALSLPFKNLKSNLSNIGIGIGTELYYGNNPATAQRFSITWYRNKAVGNGLFLYSQFIWRPRLVNDAFGEMKAGLGYLISQRPAPSYAQKNGEWVSVGKKGNAMWTVPIGLGLGSYHQLDDRQLASYLSYQFLAVTNFSQSIPVIPETLLQVGTIIQSKQ